MLTISDVHHGEHAIDISDVVDCTIEVTNTHTEPHTNIKIEIIPSNAKVQTNPTNFSIETLKGSETTTQNFQLVTSFAQGEAIPAVTLQYKIKFDIPHNQNITNPLTIEPD